MSAVRHQRPKSAVGRATASGRLLPAAFGPPGSAIGAELKFPLGVFFVSPVPAVLEPRAHSTRKIRFHAASKR